jgi:dephospho-CoA kinase
MIRSAPLLVVGLTGGIGSGKSTVARMLEAKDATVIDTDAIAREVVEPDGPAYAAVVARFGRSIVGAGGRLDRARLAHVAFADPQARADLNSIVHPAVARVVDERVAAARAGGARVVVLEVPLLIEAGWDARVDSVVVVDCPEDVAVRRLVEGRAMDEADVRRRIAAQAPRADRLARADTVLDNSGPREELGKQVDAFWSRLCGPEPPSS